MIIDTIINCRDIASLLRFIKNILKNNDIDSYNIDAELLLVHALNFSSRSEILLRYDDPITADDIIKVQDLVERRLRREPIAYITGQQAFWDFVLKVSPDTLIPRPESELLVEIAASFISSNFPVAQTIRYLDLATGSGAVALATTQELRKKYLEVVAVGSDVSKGALSIAEYNANHLGIDIDLVHSDWFSSLKSHSPFHIITCNPPYIASQEVQHLQPEVKLHEPLIALTDQGDGLNHYRNIAKDLHHYLLPGGLALFECGYTQAHTVANIFLNHTPKSKVDNIFKDLSGIDRVVAISIS